MGEYALIFLCCARLWAPLPVPQEQTAGLERETVKDSFHPAPSSWNDFWYSIIQFYLECSESIKNKQNKKFFKYTYVLFMHKWALGECWSTNNHHTF